MTPAKATPKMQVAVWWRCAAGNEWEEKISNRTALSKWKGGDVASCRKSVGYKISYLASSGSTGPNWRSWVLVVNESVGPT
ncbi:zinc-ribbon domain-containing protein [Streptomyces sp. NPDC006173]|uniref:zinc-ribbon domain-containing protein n=1 Tax=Streptomyces sp. NPDC006173 TaxID=3155349 RepID=UPI00340B79B1